MPEFFSIADVVDKPFLFVSYKHTNRAVVEETTRFLLDEGVRLWWDTAFTAGDVWTEEALALIAHPNCRGVVFVCSPEAYLSEPIHKERVAALQTYQQRKAEKLAQGEKDAKVFPLIMLNLCASPVEGTSMRILQAALTQADDVDSIKPAVIRSVLELVGDDNDRIYIPAPIAPDARKEWQQKLLADIIVGTPEVVSKGSLAKEEMQKVSGQTVVIAFGRYNDAPLEWQLVLEDETATTGCFLLRKTLLDKLAIDVADWLNGPFLDSFTEEEKALLVDNGLRLLKKSEHDHPTYPIPPTEGDWWLQDKPKKNHQLFVRADGKVSGLPQLIHIAPPHGVRPLITLKLTDAKKYVKAQ